MFTARPTGAAVLLALLLWPSSLPAARLALAGVTVTPHVRAESMRYRLPVDTNLAARVQLFIRNASPEPIGIRSDAAVRFDGLSPAELVVTGQWAWHDTPDCWPGQPVNLTGDDLTVWTFNGKTSAWGPGTRHTLTVDQGGERLLETEFAIERPSVWLSAVSFEVDRPFFDFSQILAHVVNDSDAAVRLTTWRTYASSSLQASRTLTPPIRHWSIPERSGSGQGVVPPGDRGWVRLPLYPDLFREPRSSHLVLELVIEPPNATRRFPWELTAAATHLWVYCCVRPEVFDISGGWVAGDINGRQALTLEPYLKTLKSLHINTGHIAETPGYTDNTNLYRRYPLKYFNKLQPFEVYNQPAMRPRIHAVEFLGEPQYGGGRPVPPQEVFTNLQPYQSTFLPTTVTHSEERIWRHYAGLSDYAHYDAYRVTAPAADAWSSYDRWDGQRIRWGAPLETIGDMTRSLRDLYRPASIAYWSQGAHHGWEVYGGRRRTSPTPDELRLQAYHALANRITSLYWFNLSLRSLVKFRDLIEPIQRVGREIRMLEDFYTRGDAYDYQRVDRDGQPDWDLSSIVAPQGALLFALDLDYHPDPEEKVFRFGDPRPAEFEFRLPGYLRPPKEVFRVDADGTHDVDSRITDDGVVIRDTVSRVGIYVAAPENALSSHNRRVELQSRHRQWLWLEQEVGFDPAHNDVDFALLKGLLQLPPPRAQRPLDPTLEEWISGRSRYRLTALEVPALDAPTDVVDTRPGSFSWWRRETPDGQWWHDWLQAIDRAHFTEPLR